MNIYLILIIEPFVAVATMMSLKAGIFLGAEQLCPAEWSQEPCHILIGVYSYLDWDLYSLTEEISSPQLGQLSDDHTLHQFVT